jgi:hypothetical protein
MNAQQLSRPPATPAGSWDDPPGMGRALTLGIAAGMAASFLGVGGAFLVAGQGWGAAIGMGAFVAAWGGFGFGFMVSGVIWATRAEDAERRARSEAASGGVRPGDPALDIHGEVLDDDDQSNAVGRSGSAPLRAAS